MRYKPLLARITDEEGYEQSIEETADALRSTLSAVSTYFQNDGFMRVLPEFERYDRLVPRHVRAFQQTKAAWAKIMRCLEQQK